MKVSHKGSLPHFRYSANNVSFGGGTMLKLPWSFDFA